MAMEHTVSSLAIDLTQIHRRTVTSFYSNLVTRPTGQAVRMGVESQLMELEDSRGVCLSVLDFSQVLVLDYSCADEIVAKLLLRYVPGDRPTEAYFVARGLQDHHREAIEAVLERHDLRLVVDEVGREPIVLGPTDVLERVCWSAVSAQGRAALRDIAVRAGIAEEAAAATLSKMVAQRVVVRMRDDAFCAVSSLAASR
jgi:hypothetical protein